MKTQRGLAPRKGARPQSAFFRVMDANLNRAREGLRVCEETARMVLDDAALTRRCQRLRYSVDRAARLLPVPKLLQARDSRSDVGRPALRGAASRHRKVQDLVAANLKRVQEAFRVLEEFSRLIKPSAGRAFGTLRFKAYSLEQTFNSGRKTLRHR